MAGFNRYEVALFIRASDTTLQNQARNWLQNRGIGNFTNPREFIRQDDPDDQAARFVGFAFTCDAETAYRILRLTKNPAFSEAKVRYSCRSRKKLRQMIKEELDERGWRLKPQEVTQ